MINGITWLVVTKLDVLDELAEIPVCVGYKIDGKTTTEAPAQASEYDKIECVYKKLPDGKHRRKASPNWRNCPRRPADYLDFLEKESGAKIGMVSTGPDRDHTTFIDEFAAELKTATKKV